MHYFFYKFELYFHILLDSKLLEKKFNLWKH
jgi:hypothetical protein